MSARQDLLNTSSLVKVKPTVICDTECSPNFWSIGFKRISDGKLVIMEKSHRAELDVDRLTSIMLRHRIITFNGMSYDAAMIWLAIGGASNAELKKANDKIILGGLKYWQVEDALQVRIPRKMDHIDLIEPQPNAFASLKTLAGRLHAPKMQDLPFHPDVPLTDEQMDITLAYMGNDLDNTHLLFDALKEPLELRAALGAEYGMDFMSKSDSQIGEAIVKKRVEQITGEKVEKVNTPAGSSFPYRVPEYMQFDNPELHQVVERLRTTEFFVQHDGKVDLPAWLDGKTVTIGDTTYAMGIGGLHSTEKNRAVHSDDDFVLIDFDVASYYPAIILNSGLYPKALGRVFLDVYRKIRDERVIFKHRSADKSLSEAERSKAKTAAEGLKISLNGVYGKLGSRYSILYAPHLMIAVTLTGQLALLMLIDRAERAGIPVVSANTDGVVFRCPRDREDDLEAITKQWEADTAFTLESTRYKSLYNQSVNSYVAIKEDNKAKIKGAGWTGRHDGDMRTQLMKNPSMEIAYLAVVALMTKGTPLEETIRACRDIREFVTVVNVKGGGTWRGEYLGKVVRYYWAKGGTEILYKTPHAVTGNFKKVSKTEGCRPLMDLPEVFPDDIDYDAYLEAAEELLKDLGAVERPPVYKPLRIPKYKAIGWFAVAC
jgi:hypothetical protein